MRAFEQEVGRLGRLGGLAGLPLILAAQIVLASTGGDIRDGGFPLLVALAAGAWLACVATIWRYHPVPRSLILRVGLVVLSIGMIGTAIGFGAIWIGAVFGIEEGAGSAGWIVVVSIVTGVFGIPLGLLITGIAAVRAAEMPLWGRWLPLGMVALIPLGMLGVGATGGTLEVVIGFAWFISFAAGWAVIGWSVRSTRHP